MPLTPRPGPELCSHRGLGQVQKGREFRGQVISAGQVSVAVLAHPAGPRACHSPRGAPCSFLATPLSSVSQTELGWEMSRVSTPTACLSRGALDSRDVKAQSHWPPCLAGSAEPSCRLDSRKTCVLGFCTHVPVCMYRCVHVCGIHGCLRMIYMCACLWVCGHVGSMCMWVVTHAHVH